MPLNISSGRYVDRDISVTARVYHLLSPTRYVSQRQALERTPIPARLAESCFCRYDYRDDSQEDPLLLVWEPVRE